MNMIPGELDGQDSFEEVFENQEEDSFEKVPKVTTQNPVQEVCQSAGSGKQKAGCPGIAWSADQ
jgi:hypothetical protein